MSGENISNSKQPTIPTSDVRKGTGRMSPAVKWIIGIIILAVVGYGGWWIWQNQKANIKNQNDISKVKDITPATETPIIATQEPTATTPDHAAGLSAKDSSTEDWKTYTANPDNEPTFINYSIKYPSDWTYQVVSDFTIFKDSNGKERIGIENTLASVTGVDPRSYLPGGEDLASFPSLNVGIYKGYSSTVSGTVDYSKTIIVRNPGNEKENILFHITTVNEKEYNSFKSTLNQILSTFKFIE